MKFFWFVYIMTKQYFMKKYSRQRERYLCIHVIYNLKNNFFVFCTVCVFHYSVERSRIDHKATKIIVFIFYLQQTWTVNFHFNLYSHLSSSTVWNENRNRTRQSEILNSNKKREYWNYQKLPHQMFPQQVELSYCYSWKLVTKDNCVTDSKMLS